MKCPYCQSFRVNSNEVHAYCRRCHKHFDPAPQRRKARVISTAIVLILLCLLFVVTKM